MKRPESANFNGSGVFRARAQVYNKIVLALFMRSRFGNNSETFRHRSEHKKKRGFHAPSY